MFHNPVLIFLLSTRQLKATLNEFSTIPKTVFLFSESDRLLKFKEAFLNQSSLFLVLILGYVSEKIFHCIKKC